jgi:hypothetical protein
LAVAIGIQIDGPARQARLLGVESAVAIQVVPLAAVDLGGAAARRILRLRQPRPDDRRKQPPILQRLQPQPPQLAQPAPTGGRSSLDRKLQRTVCPRTRLLHHALPPAASLGTPSAATKRPVPRSKVTSILSGFSMGVTRRSAHDPLVDSFRQPLSLDRPRRGSRPRSRVLPRKDLVYRGFCPGDCGTSGRTPRTQGS